MAKFTGTKGDHRKPGSVGRTQKGTGYIAKLNPMAKALGGTAQK